MQKRKSAGTSIEVLIDTWWNVNVGDLSADCIDRDCFKVDSRRFLAGNI